MVQEQGDVPEALAQRRHAHADHVQPIPEILTEPARLHEQREIAMGGSDHAHVHVPHALGADRAKLTAL